MWCKKMNKRITILGISCLLLLIFFSVKSLSVGVTSEYYDGNPLQMFPGQTKIIYLELQNMVGNEDIYLKGAITQEKDVAQITDASNVYFVPYGKKDVKVAIKITLPADAVIGERKNVMVSFISVTPGQTSGTVRIGLGIDKIIPVNVNAPAKPEKSPMTSSYWIIGALIIIVAFILYLMLKKKKSKKK